MISLKASSICSGFALLTIGISTPLPLQPAAAADPAQPMMGEQHRALLKENCLSCHNETKKKGGIRLDDLPFAVNNGQAAERWQQVLDQMNSGDMPPEDEKQPEKSAKANFLDDLAHVMVAARRTLADQQGEITMRRLNRREYQNTLRELLGVEINVSELPSDTGTGGFDTVGSNLFMSGNQFEQYLSLGRDAVDEAFDRLANAAVEKKLRYEAEVFTPIVEKFNAGEIDARERAQRWVKGVEEAAAKPENAEVVAKIRKASKNDAIFRRSWAEIPGAPSPESFGFVTKENNSDKANAALNPYYLPYHQHYLTYPAIDKGAYLSVQTTHPSLLQIGWITMLVPFNWPAGDYTVRIRIAGNEHATPDRRFLEFGINPNNNGLPLSTHEVTGTMENPQMIEIPLTMTRKHTDRADRMLFIREKGTADTNERMSVIIQEARKRNGLGPEMALWVDWMDIERKTAPATPPPALAALNLPLDDKAPAPDREALHTGLSRFAAMAFRGKATPPSYLDGLVRFYEMRRAAGDKPSAALKDTLAVVLSSPGFLYLAEPATDEIRRPLTGVELATRLSYFLWSAPPDVELRTLAARGELSRAEVLTAQTNRLLNDPRAAEFVRAFGYQWLGMDRLDFFQVNQILHPRFSNGMKLAARDEVYEIFAHVLRQGNSLRDLLKSDYVVINGLLANYYGIEGVHGDAYRKVALPAGSPRGGLLGMAAVHLMGGNGEHTSPVERGAWVLRKLLNDPPPPAPANVPALTRLAGKVLTPRERMLAHQEDAQCASCHRKIDPIGFGLENFDAAGLWRTEDSYTVTGANGRPDPKTKKTWTIDPAAKLHNGPAFKDYQGLRDIIATRADAFARGYSSALIEYALGRPCGFSDEPLVNAMITQARGKNLAAREFIHALVLSKAFHTK